MKICAVICEHNPFHNGHRYLLQQARLLSGCDAILCVMSGNFVQRGQIAIAHKSVRAKFTIDGGADAVLELPTLFATAGAFAFAKGAISMLAQIPSVTHLAFGTECGSAEDFYRYAGLSETPAIQSSIRLSLQSGLSPVKARELAFQQQAESDFPTTPNAILGLEYTKAILEQKANIAILPIPRMGANHADLEKRNHFASASALRANWQDRAFLSGNLPQAEIPAYEPDIEKRFELACLCTLFRTPPEVLRKTPDCAEGLEFKLLRADARDYTSLLSECTSKRYPTSRIRRILLENFLGITKALLQSGLHNTPYLRLLAVRSERDMLPVLAQTQKLLTRHTDGYRLTGFQRDCYAIDLCADKLYRTLSLRTPSNRYYQT